MESFNFSAAAASAPITLAEARVLLSRDLGTLARDVGALRVLAQRVYATVADRDQEHAKLTAAVARASERRRFLGAPLLAAFDAVGKLTPDERSQLFSLEADRLLEELRAATLAARRAGADADLRSRALGAGTTPEREPIGWADDLVPPATVPTPANDPFNVP